MSKRTGLLFGLLIFLSTPLTFAEESNTPSEKGFAATLGASYELGQLGNSGMDLQDRAMTAISLEALPAYRINSKWLVGVDFDYRFQQQQTSLSSAGGTNLAGKGYLLGLGAQYRFNEKWAVQAALDLFGKYDFDRQTSGSEDDHIEGPLGIRAKAQYFLWDSWSVDGSAGYQSWRMFHVSGTSHSESSNQWMIGAGVTYHFGGFKKSHDAEEPAATAPPTAASAPSASTAQEKVPGSQQNRRVEITVNGGNQ